MSNINPQTRNKRISMPERINNFVACAVHCGYANRDSLTRKEVKSICEVTGIVYPRWLAKDASRRLERGIFSFPELKAAGVTTIQVDTEPTMVDTPPEMVQDFVEDDPQTDMDKQANEELHTI